MRMPPLPAPRIRQSARTVAGVLVLGSLLACGYKGPLYLPPPEDPPAELTTPPGHDTAPASPAN